MYPEGLKYTKEHEWAKIEGNNAVIGITDFAQKELGDIVFVELPAKGSELKQMAEFGVVESVKTVSTLYSPLGGSVTEVNQALAKSPELINEDPYEKGWIIKIKIKDEKEAEKLLSAKAYEELVRK